MIESSFHKKVKLVLKTWPKAASLIPPKPAVPATILNTFYFPGCSVERALDKDIRVISMSGKTKVIDLLRTDDAFRIFGTWLNDDDKNYDSLTCMERQEILFELCTVTELYGVITWDDKTYDETLYVIPHDLHVDNEPGNTGIMGFNFLFAVLAKEPSV